ncbi:otoferlin-like [Vespa mandarinia]|uniref:otoferlin-like n=1 Tax=Vespa mandarinia TaxID=7446 RepID=UPI00161EA4F8|nr:otoferlin-like [Vespa mandarinia]
MKKSNYHLCVKIIEARHLQQLANSMVIVKLGKKKKKTNVQEGTDCPIYNEYFVFDFIGDFETFLSTRITIAVYLRNYLRQLKFYGSTILDVEAVWEQPDHQYHHKWAMLTDPKSLSSEAKGYVKCNISVKARGEKVRVYPETEGEDDIESNLLLPIGGESLLFTQRAQYIFTVYRADGLPNMTSLCSFGDTGGINPYLQISFAGMKKNLWKVEEYILFGIVYDVCMIDRRRFGKKSIVFELSIGNAGNRRFSRDQCDLENDNENNRTGLIPRKRKDFQSQTVRRTTGTFDGKYNYLPLGSKKPCIYVRSWWPNFERRMFNINNLRFIVNFLEMKLKEVGTLTAMKNPKAYEIYNKAIRTFKYHCQHYLHTLDDDRYYEEINGMIKLDRHRANLCSKQIDDILRRIKIDGEIPNNHYIEIAMMHAYQYLRELRGLCEDPQDGLPRVFLWMLAGSKRVAYVELPAERIIYSEESPERGVECGQCINVFPKNPKNDMESEETIDLCACKIELFIWLGNAKFIASCWSSIPPGYIISDRGEPIDVFPKYFEYDRSSSFQLRAHIFQGQFDPGMDASALLDPFVNVTFLGHTLTTSVIRQSLDPLWDESLIFPIVKIHGTKEYIKIMPPRIVLQIFDRDICGMKEFCGRCIAVPLVKLSTETYSPPDFLPKLEWYRFQSRKDYTGSILAAFELVEMEETDMIDVRLKEEKCNIPPYIRPKMASYRMEVIFWGVRDIKNLHYVPVYRPRIVIECAGVVIKSQVMENAKEFNNFEDPRVMVNLEMPELKEYYPCMTIRVYDSRGFGCFKYVGISNIPTVYVFLEQLITEEDYRAQIYETKSERRFPWKAITVKQLPYVLSDDSIREERKGLIEYKKTSKNGFRRKIFYLFEHVKKLLKWKKLIKKKKTKKYDTMIMDDSLDWWSKYFASIEGHISIYRWPHPENLSCKTRHGRDAVNGICDDYPPQQSVKLLVRLYVIKGINLHPKDILSGKSDPYLCISLGKIYINDKKNHIPNQLNPIFGRVFELEATFPQDYLLSIQVWDHDATSTDDLIGETQIDIENRFYSRHRAKCGLAKTYETSGYNIWRDREKPTQILDFLCMKNNLSTPIYDREEVRIGKHRFPFRMIVDNDTDREECMALNVLHQWQDFPICGCALVPEHIERRPLFNATKPGLEQGRLEVWVDMFPVGNLPPRPAVNITPLEPEEYEIRVIVWNTEDVPLMESQFLTGEKSSDIYVKGWILQEDRQKTDVHYNSLTGEGNFNWRFVFRLVYSMSENVMVVRKKLSIFAKNETEEKLPCRLHLEVWDSDHFSKDDFLGALTLNLSKMPRGSANSKSCTMKLLEPKLPTVNLFKVTRLKAWWPLVRRTETVNYVQAGKIEMELSILRGVEANESPVGKGRNPPQELPPPKRPDTSYSWFFNPWKAFRHIVFRYYKWKILLCIICILLVFLVASGLYAFPGYFVKRLLGA